MLRTFLGGFGRLSLHFFPYYIFLRLSQRHRILYNWKTCIIGQGFTFALRDCLLAHSQVRLSSQIFTITRSLHWRMALWCLTLLIFSKCWDREFSFWLPWLVLLGCDWAIGDLCLRCSYDVWFWLLLRFILWSFLLRLLLLLISFILIHFGLILVRIGCDWVSRSVFLKEHFTEGRRVWGAWSTILVKLDKPGRKFTDLLQRPLLFKVPFFLLVVVLDLRNQFCGLIVDLRLRKLA